MAELVKKPAASAGDTRGVGLIPGSGRSSRVGNGNPLQYSCMDQGAWQAAVLGVTELNSPEHAHAQPIVIQSLSRV